MSGLITGRRVTARTPEFLGWNWEQRGLCAAPLGPLHRGTWPAPARTPAARATPQDHPAPVRSCPESPALPPRSITERAPICNCPAEMSCAGVLQARPLPGGPEGCSFAWSPAEGAEAQPGGPLLRPPSSSLGTHCSGLWAKPGRSALLKSHRYWELQIKSVSVTSHWCQLLCIFGRIFKIIWY